MQSQTPYPIEHFWQGLPRSLTHIDAIYERPQDGKIMFFVGQEYYLFNSNRIEPGYPKPLTNLGLPQSLPRIDAALVWSHNGKTYLFYKDRYWKLDESDGKVELDYPRPMDIWKVLKLTFLVNLVSIKLKITLIQIFVSPSGCTS